MSITEVGNIGSWFGLAATLVTAVVLYLRWRSDVIFVKPSTMTNLQASNTRLSNDLDFERVKRRELEDQLRHFTQACDRRVNELEQRIQELEENNGTYKERQHG